MKMNTPVPKPRPVNIRTRCIAFALCATLSGGVCSFAKAADTNSLQKGTSFEVKGVKLGMELEDVQRTLSALKYDCVTNNLGQGSVLWNIEKYTLECTMPDAKLRVSITEKPLGAGVYAIHYHKDFPGNIDLAISDKLKSDLAVKYGKPQFELKENSTPGSDWTLCWGVQNVIGHFPDGADGGQEMVDMGLDIGSMPSGKFAVAFFYRHMGSYSFDLHAFDTAPALDYRHARTRREEESKKKSLEDGLGF